MECLILIFPVGKSTWWAVELVNSQQGVLKGDQQPPELLPELTRIISGD